MILAHTIALDPTIKQINALTRAAGVSRFTWNWALAELDRQYKAGEKPTAIRLRKQWNSIKREKFPWVMESPKGANQQPFTNLSRAFQGFFKKKKGRPKFKKKGQRDSFYVENTRLRVVGPTVRLPVIGFIRMREPLRFTGKIMNGIVYKTVGRWFISISVDIGDATLHRVGNEMVGIDLGLTSFATLSTGEKIKAPKPLNKELKRLKKAQQVVTRRVKGSTRTHRARQHVAKIHHRIANIRRDFLNKLSTKIIRENQTVTIEDLAVKNMMRNRRLARAISDVSWYEFRRQLEYKSKRYGTIIIIADIFFPSSKTCNSCGQVNSNLKLSDRIFKCCCGYVEDRDINAALNLRTLGLRETYARGQEGSGSWVIPVTKPRLDETRITPWIYASPQSRKQALQNVRTPEDAVQ